MTERPYVDPQSLGDQDMHLYETIATLEWLGHPVTRSQIGETLNVADDELDEMLRFLTERRLLIQAGESGAEPSFIPARRDWSAVPDQPEGPRRL